MQAIFITGLSGAGKSQAMKCLEDQGYYCIDNMPPALVMNFLDLALNQEGAIEKVAFVMDIRGNIHFGDLRSAFHRVKERGIETRILFLEASNQVLIRRFNETRRMHPLTHRPVTEADIQEERQALELIRKDADRIIDTSNMKTAQLKEELLGALTDKTREETFVINIMSFGFKYGIPITADMVFDMRFIPNPYYVASLKKLTGNNKKVQNYVLQQQVAQTFIKNLDRLVNSIVPCYMKEGKWNLNIAFGCTGGQHRSVSMANAFYERFKLQGKQVTLDHRDIKK